MVCGRSRVRSRRNRARSGNGAVLVHFLDIRELPGPVEPRLKGTVETEDRVPALVGDGLDPVALHALWRGRAEVNVDGGIGVDREACLLAADAGELLAGLEFRARLAVVNGQGPQVLDGDVGGKVQAV